MKTNLYFTFTLLTFFLILILLPNSFAQVPRPYNMVRLIYFVPRDRTPQPDMNTKLNTLIKDVQTFFADEMERHGFGRKTFVFETDTDGNAAVHRVNGNHLDAHYHQETEKKIREEVFQRFDTSKNIYFIVVDVSTELIGDFCGRGADSQNEVGERGGWALIPASGECFAGDHGFTIAAHELGHAFGLFHDFSNDTYLMSYGFLSETELAPCSAEWFNANRYFNTRQTRSNWGETVIEMLPPVASLPYGVRFQFKVSDPDGLQIAHLLTPATDKTEAPGQLKLLDCENLTGKSQTAEFVTTELTTQSESVTLRIVDSVDNLVKKKYQINMSDLLPRKVVSIPDPNLAAAIRNALGLIQGSRVTQLDMLGLRELSVRNQEITDLTGLEHARNLKHLDLSDNKIGDITVLAQLPNLTTVRLGSNQISDFTPLAKLTNLVELALSSNPVDDISPVTELTQLRRLHLSGYQIQDLTPFARFTNLRDLSLENNQIVDITPLAALTELQRLWLSGNQISDITSLPTLTKLQWLFLFRNQIVDITPLAELTELQRLGLDGNQIIDITPLTGLTELQWLWLSRNQISDITSLAALTKLEVLWLNDNQIIDITPLTGLTELQWLWLDRNQIVDITPLTGFVGLERLILTGNPILNTSALQTLPQKNPNLELDIVVAQRDPVFPLHTKFPTMYWVDRKNGTLHRTMGNNVENLLPSVQNATSLAVDMTNEKLYWTEKTSNTTGKVQRATLDGTNVQLVKELTSVPLDIVLDTVSSKLYLTNSWGKLQRLNFDGTNFQTNLITGLESPTDIALDIEGGKVYWTETVGSIRRANLDGSEVETLATDLGTPQGITVANNNIYWTEQISGGVSKIQRADLNGENLETLATVGGTPHGIGIDIANRKLYWTNAVGGIQRADISGGNMENLVTELTTPGDFALSSRVVRVLVAESQRPPMYWVEAEAGTLYRLTGAAVENIAPSVQNATSLAVDTVNNKLYWTEKTSDRTGKVRRANLDGTNVEVVKELTSVPHGIVLDVMARKLYWTNSWGKIQRLNFDRSNSQSDLITGLESPRHLAVDVAGGKLYWTGGTENATGKIQRANLDGSNIQTIVTELGTLGSIAIANGKVYWTEKTGENIGKIQRTNLDGTSPETLTTLMSVPFGIAVNTAEHKFYWTNAEGKIQRANLNGSNVENLVTELGGTPTNIILGAGPIDTAAATAPASVAVAPDETLLYPNYPNPFNPETWIPYQLAKSAEVTVTIYAMDGQVVRTLALGHKPAGMYQNRSRAAYWDGRNAVGESVASGIYFYTLTADDFTATRKMLIRK